MKIPIIDDIVMTSDAHNIILNRPYKVQSGKHKGQTMLRAYAFYPSVVTAMESLLDQKLAESTARTLKELCAQHQELTALFREMLGAKGKLKEVKE